MTHESLSKILHDIHVKSGELYYLTETVIQAMKEAVNQVLDEVSEKAEIIEFGNGRYYVNKDSITSLKIK